MVPQRERLGNSTDEFIACSLPHHTEGINLITKVLDPAENCLVLINLHILKQFYKLDVLINGELYLRYD